MSKNYHIYLAITLAIFLIPKTYATTIGSDFVNDVDSTNSTFKLKVNKMENYSIEKGLESGLSGSFVGSLNDHVIMAGGCNFPENPLSPQSKKKFYEGIYILNLNNESEAGIKRIGSLPKPMAYGSCVSLPDGLMLIGGADMNSSYNEVYKLLINNDGEAVLENYPPLPFPVDNAYATLLSDKVYLAGGNQNGMPSNNLLMLDLKDPSQGWQELKKFPGNPRVQPVIGGYENPDGNGYLYIWGGFSPKGENREATLNTDGLRYDIKKAIWKKVNGPTVNNGEEVSLGGGTLATLTDGRMVITGGVNKDIFLNALRNQAPDYLTHPIEWYKFNPIIFIFNPGKELWETWDMTQNTARAGAGTTVIGKNSVIVVGGELKPRIRTSENYTINLE